MTCHHVFSRTEIPCYSPSPFVRAVIADHLRTLGKRDSLVSPAVGVPSPVSHIREEVLLQIESLLTPATDAGHISTHHPILRVAQERDCILGDVFLTSGLCRTSPGDHRHALDWGLISVRQTRLTDSAVWSNVSLALLFWASRFLLFAAQGLTTVRTLLAQPSTS